MRLTLILIVSAVFIAIVATVLIFPNSSGPEQQPSPHAIDQEGK